MSPFHRIFIALAAACVAVAVEVPEVHQVFLRDVWWQDVITDSGAMVYARDVGDPTRFPNGLGRIEHTTLVWKNKTYPITSYEPAADGGSFTVGFELGTISLAQKKDRLWSGVWVSPAGERARFRTLGQMWEDVIPGKNRTLGGRE